MGNSFGDKWAGLIPQDKEKETVSVSSPEGLMSDVQKLSGLFEEKAVTPSVGLAND